MEEEHVSEGRKFQRRSPLVNGFLKPEGEFRRYQRCRLLGSRSHVNMCVTNKPADVLPILFNSDKI